MRPAVVILIVAIGVGLRFLAQEPKGNRAYRGGRLGEAAESYREALAKGDASPRLHYNLGTTYLRLGEAESARERLGVALQAQAPELRARAFYNLGNAYSQEVATPTPESLRAAIEAYRRSLLLEPGNEDARWNLELAQRRLAELERQPPPSGGQEGAAPSRRGEDSDSGAGSGAGESPQTLPQPGSEQAEAGVQLGTGEAPFPRELAEQVLRAVEERERALQREKLRRQRSRVTGPDW
ncbi:MAG: tetratricopeptide repeat protein [Gemmatimonadota bacterium]|nr:MAG: tetratricopeptide repeat protein [Gemmatimonadota bacterium]